MEENVTKIGVVDLETGSVLKYIQEGDRIVRGRSMEAIEGKTLNFNKGESFVKSYDDGMRTIRKILTNAQFSFICHLLPQIEYNTNILRNDDGTIMETKDMELITGMQYNANRKLLLSLVDLGIMGIWQTGSKDKKDLKFECFVVNPYIFHKGTMIPDGLLELFSKTGWGK